MKFTSRLLFFILILIPVIAFPKNLFETLQTEKANGALSTKDYLTYLVYTLHDPSRLPEKYRNISVKPIKSGTFLRFYLKQHQDLLDEPTRAILKANSFRPNLPDDIISASGRFKVHYATSGYHAVSATDSDRNGLPDYAEEAARVLDYSYKLIVDSLGYKEHLGDDGVDGAEYDVYLVNLGSLYYGSAELEFQKSTNPETWSAYSLVHANFSEAFPTRGVDALRVTCAHEYFHAIQLAYSYRDDDRFFYEISSTWMEDYAYSYVNDYINYLNNFFAKPNTQFDKYDGIHEYGACLWNHLLCKKFGPDVIRWTWKRMAEKPERGALGALNDALIKAGSSFNIEFTSFSLWNYFTGSRADTINYYPEGQLYPEISFKGQYSFRTDISLADSSKKFAPVYYYFTDSENSRNFALILTNLEYHNYNWNALSKYQLSIVDIPINDSYQKLDTRLFVQFKAPVIELWRGQAPIIYSDGNVKIAAFGTQIVPPSEKQGTILYLFPNPFFIGRDHDFKVYFRVEKRSWVEAMILTAHGRMVKAMRINDSITIPGYLEKGIYPQLEWDGTNNRGEYVANGVYIFCLKIGDSVVLKKFSVIRK